MNKWLNIELNKEYANKFISYCNNLNIKTEVSAIEENWRHIEVYANDAQINTLNDFLDTL